MQIRSQFPPVVITGKSQALGAFTVDVGIESEAGNANAVLNMGAYTFAISANTSAAATAGSLAIKYRTHVNNQYEDLPGTTTAINLIGTNMATIIVSPVYIQSLQFTPSALDGDKSYGVTILQGQT